MIVGRSVFWIVAVMFVLASAGAASAFEGRVLDSVTGQPIGGATVTAGDIMARSDADGNFAIQAPAQDISARAAGYKAAPSGTEELAGGSPTIRLTPFMPKALYLSFYGIGHKPTRDAALKLIAEGHGLNALVIDVKGDRGGVAFPTDVPLAREIGADRILTIPDLPGLLKQLHEKGIYAIARLVVFKDDPLSRARPDLAVKSAAGTSFRDREGMGWTDPFSPEVWTYNIDIATDAARAGFDEIQFDYVRFPDAKDARFSEASTETTRIGAITGFLAEARRRLTPYNTFLAVDVFGYVCWNLDDTHIGQRIEDVVPLVDYVSPMLYPSGFQFGIPGFRNPVQHPYEIVQHSLESAISRTHVSPAHFRPWLQAFKDYAFDGRMFAADEVKTQIDAAESAGTDGWMLWNPRNIYAEIGF